MTHRESPTRPPGIEVGLHAVAVAVDESNPLVLIVRNSSLAALPFGPFDPMVHRTMEVGLRDWVEAQTRLKLGYVEQLYTFGDEGRTRAEAEHDLNLVSVGYLALVRQPSGDGPASRLSWSSWYRHFPWEDWRDGQPNLLGKGLLPALSDWVRASPKQSTGGDGLERLVRFRLAFGCDLPERGPATIKNWDDERVLERYELMYEAGLVEEAVTDGLWTVRQTDVETGEPMLHDHRRILATAIARLRGKLKYRPVVFELMPRQFTLTQLQQAVEHLAGRKIHKQNFRRLVENAELVEPTGAKTAQTGGRPAAYYRFRRSILRERPAPGLRIGSHG